MNGSLFNNDLMHNRTKKNNKYFIPVSIEATANHQTLLLHQRLHEMKTVQTFLNEEQDTETASPSKSESVALASSAPTSSTASPVHGLMDCISNPFKCRVQFSNIKNEIGRACQVRSRGRVVVTSSLNAVVLL